MRKIYIVIAIAVCVMSCSKEPENWGWKYTETIALEGINPIGLAATEDGFWISDGDHNRVVKIDATGKKITSIDSLDRPMHIAENNGQLVIPQYGNDEVIRFRESVTPKGNPETILISLLDSLDAPAGADIKSNEIAVADFYNNRIHYANAENKWIIFGKKGKAAGEFNYPTDVQITKDAIWVADAYNNRLQKFSKDGKHQLTVGEAQKMNATTGMFVSDEQLFATDFENDRVLVYGLDGSFMQELKQEINKPTDMIVKDGKLVVANYKSSSLSIYSWSILPKILEEKSEVHPHDIHKEVNLDDYKVGE